MGIREWLIILGINAGLLFVVQFILSIRIIRSEGLSFWSFGRFFNDEVLLFVIKKKNLDKSTARLVNIGRALLIIFIATTIVFGYLLKTKY
jgi:hypothetical protein